MAKKSKFDKKLQTWTIGFVLCFGAILWVIDVTAKVFLAIWPVLLIIPIAVIGFYLFKHIDKARTERIELSVKNYFDLYEYEFMEAYHSTYFRDDLGEYDYTTIEKWIEAANSVLNEHGFPDGIIETDRNREKVLKLIHAQAERHEEQGELKYSFQTVNSHEMMVETTIAEFELNGWLQIQTTADGVEMVDAKLQKNGQSLNLICIYDIGKVGIGKIRNKILDARMEPANATALVSPHGFTRLALRLGAEAGVFCIAADRIPFLDNKMGI